MILVTLMTWKWCEFTVKQSFFRKELACWRWFFKFMVWTNSKVSWSGMPLVFVQPLATGWELLPAGSGCTSSTPRCWRWDLQLLFISCWLSGEIFGITWKRRRETPGTICREYPHFWRLNSQYWLYLIIHNQHFVAANNTGTRMTLMGRIITDFILLRRIVDLATYNRFFRLFIT